MSGQGEAPGAGAAARLKAQMQADALRPLSSDSVGSGEDEDGECPLRVGTGVDSSQEDHAEAIAVWSEEMLLQIGGYLRLSVSCSLRFPLSHQPPIWSQTTRTRAFSCAVISPFGRSFVACTTFIAPVRDPPAPG